MAWGTGVTPKSTYPGDWGTGWAIVFLLDETVRAAALHSSRPARGPPDLEDPVVESKVTVKLVPDEPSADVVSRRLPLLLTMLMATACQAESLIGPVTPLIVAEALVNVMVPKFARADWLLPPPPTRVGASTIHSAELRAAVTTSFVPW